MASAAPGVLLLSLHAAARLARPPEGCAAAAIQLPARWLEDAAAALRPHLGSLPCGDLAAAICDLKAAGARPTPAFASDTAAALLAAADADADAGTAAGAQLLAWLAVEEEGGVSDGSAFAAAADALIPLVSLPRLSQLLKAAAQLPAPRAAALHAALWRWLQSERPAAGPGKLLSADQLAELIWRLPHPAPPAPAAAAPPAARRSAAGAAGAQRGVSGLLHMLRGRGAAALRSAGGGAAAEAGTGGGAALGRLEDALTLLGAAAERDAGAALEWLPEALSLVTQLDRDESARLAASRQATAASGAPALEAAAAGGFEQCEATEAAAARLCGLVGSLAEADAPRALAAAAAAAEVLSSHAAALGPGAFLDASERVLWMSAGARRQAAAAEEAGGNGERWVAAAQGAAAAWLRKLPTWADTHAIELDAVQTTRLLSVAAALQQEAAAGPAPPPAPAAAGAAWLAAAEVRLAEAAAAPGGAPPGGAALAAACGALLQLGRVPAGQLLASCLEAAGSCYMAMTASDLCDLISLLAAAAAEAGGALPPRHAALANAACGALASKRAGAAPPRALARAAGALAALAARGGAGQWVTPDVLSLERMLGGGPSSASGDGTANSGGSGSSSGAPAGWRPPAQAVEWLLNAWGAAAQAAPASCLVGFSDSEVAALLAALADCDALSRESCPASKAAGEGAAARQRLRPLLARAAARLAGARRGALPPAAAAGGVLGLAALAARAGLDSDSDPVFESLKAECETQLAERAAAWPVSAQLLLLSALGGGGGSSSDAARRVATSALVALEAGFAGAGAGGTAGEAGQAASGGAAPAGAAPPDQARLLISALSSIEAAGGARLPRRAARRLFAQARGAYEAAAARQAAGGGPPEGWPEDSALQYVQVCWVC